MRKSAFIALPLAALALTLSACSGEDAATPDTTAAAVQPLDRTTEVTSGLPKNLAQAVTKVTETEPGRLEVATTLVDPRGEDGSPEAAEAIKLCEAAMDVLQAEAIAKPYVSVLEKDGTTWVLAGHPTYGPDCTEV